MRRRTRSAAALALVALLSGCGLDKPASERVDRTIGNFAQSIASGRAEQTCRLLTPAGARELKQAFQASSCSAAARRASIVLRRSPEHGRFFKDPRPLEFPITPSGTSHLTSGVDFARIQITFFDTIAGTTQAVDVEVRKRRGEWRLGQGVGALVPNLPPHDRQAAAPRVTNPSEPQYVPLLRITRHRVGGRLLTTAVTPPISPTDPRTARFTFMPLLLASVVAMVLLLGGWTFIRRREANPPPRT
jgi:hypothetical protein